MKAGQAMVQLKSCVNQLNPVGQTLAASPVTPLGNTGHANRKTNKVYTQSCKEKKNLCPILCGVFELETLSENVVPQGPMTVCVCVCDRRQYSCNKDIHVTRVCSHRPPSE